MKYYIKNMVCNRCVMVVATIFKEAGIPVRHIELGEVETEKEVPGSKLNGIRKALSDVGFGLIDDKRKQLIEKIKSIVIDWVHYQSHQDHKVNFSEYVSSKLHKDYSYLSNLFSEVENSTIEKYLIHQKIEKVKELLVYDELTLSEIADRLGYSSVQYLSNQFKKVTGFSPNHFKKIKENRRTSLDKV